MENPKVADSDLSGIKKAAQTSFGRPLAGRRQPFLENI